MGVGTSWLPFDQRGKEGLSRVTVFFTLAYLILLLVSVFRRLVSGLLSCFATPEAFAGHGSEQKTEIRNPRNYFDAPAPETTSEDTG